MVVAGAYWQVFSGEFRRTVVHLLTFVDAASKKPENKKKNGKRRNTFDTRTGDTSKREAGYNIENGRGVGAKARRDSA